MQAGERPSEAYLVYAALTAVLDELIYAGKGDGPEAERIRDNMDAPWFAMTAEEQELFRR